MLTGFASDLIPSSIFVVFFLILFEPFLVVPFETKASNRIFFTSPSHHASRQSLVCARATLEQLYLLTSISTRFRRSSKHPSSGVEKLTHLSMSLT